MKVFALAMALFSALLPLPCMVAPALCQDDFQSVAFQPLPPPSAELASEPIGHSPAVCEAALPRCNEPCCDAPRWSVHAGAIFMNRGTPDPQVLMFPLSGPGVSALGSDFDFGWQAAPEVSLIRHYDECHSWEFRFFGPIESNASASYLAEPISQVGTFPIFGLDILNGTYESELTNAEFNVRFQASRRVTWLVGLRWLELQDDLNFNMQLFVPGNLDMSYDVQNRLLGSQIGAELALWELDSPLTITAVMKAGIYSNRTKNHFLLAEDFTPSVLVDETYSTTQVTFVGELGLNAAWRIGQHWTLRGGYQLLWIDGVSLASNQFSASNNAFDYAVLDRGNELFYHGANVGVEFTW